MRRPDKTRLFTLYSYKGGVGRTMAVANVACQMAIKHGKSVICVDWDLEAPGLHHYFDFSEQDLAERPGLLDYLMDFVVQVSRGAEGKPPDLKDYLVELKPHQREKIVFGSVRLMHCGRTDAGYMSRVQNFDWNRFYREQHGYEIIETLKKQLREEAEMTLIDARAGQADVGVVPTVQVPDAIVLLFASNRQSLHGVEQMARSFHKHPQRLAQDLPEPRILLVPARVFHEEDRYTKWIEEVATPVFNRLAAEGVVSKVDQPKGLWQCYLTVDPKYSIDETLVVLDQSPVVSRLKRSYVELAQAMNNLFHGRERIWTMAEMGLQVEDPERVATLRSELLGAVERGDREQVASLQLELGLSALAERRLDEAESLLQPSLAYHTEVDAKVRVGAALAALVVLRRLQGNKKASWAYLEELLHVAGSIGSRRLEAIAVGEMAILLETEGVPEEILVWGGDASAERMAYASQAAHWARRLLVALSAESRECPRMFTLLPEDLSILNPANFGKQGKRLTLWCEMPGCEHPVVPIGSGKPGEYVFKEAKEWLVSVGPYASLVARTLKTVVPLVGAVAKAAIDESLFKAVKPNLDFMDAGMNTLLAGDPSLERGLEEPGALPCMAEGAGLRALHAKLLELDPARQWGGLRRVAAPSGEFLWVCPSHYKEFDAGLSKRP